MPAGYVEGAWAGSIILGLLQIVGGVPAYSEAASAIHQILGAISFGMGILSIALGLAVNHLSAIRAATEQQLKIFGDRLGKTQA